MSDLSKLTAKDFSDAMHKGWRKLRYCSGHFFETKTDSTPYHDQKGVIRACAVGAAAFHLKRHPWDVGNALGDDLWSDIADASNAAGNKRAAMKAVDAILLGTKP